MKKKQIFEQIKMYCFYAFGIILLFLTFKVENSLLKAISILFGGIITISNFAKVIYYYYVDGKFALNNILKENNFFTKKSRKVDISRMSYNLFLYGLLLVFGSLLLAFKKDKSKVVIADIDFSKIDFMEAEFTPATKIEKKLPPPEMEKIEMPKEIIEAPKVFKIVTEEFIKPMETIAELPENLITEATNIDFGEEDFDFDFEPEKVIEVEKQKVADEEPEIHIFVEQMPKFVGGDKALIKYLYNNIKYPAIAKNNGIEGLVVIQFVVNQKGKITDAKIFRDIGGGCGKEALRVVNQMPNWSAGKQNNKEVKVAIKLPVKFKLN